MANATQDRNTPRRDAVQVSDPVAAGVILFAGTMYALDAAGNAVKPDAIGAGAVRGVCQATADNRSGSAGDVRVDGRRGCYRFANSSGDQVGRADIGGVCYAADDQTVANTDDGGALKVAGNVVDVDSAGVWVDVGGLTITIEA